MPLGRGSEEERGGGGGNLLTDHLNAKLIRWGCDSNLSTCPVMSSDVAHSHLSVAARQGAFG